jgi:hypothetical protein
MLMPPDVTTSMRLIIDRATRAQVSFYSVDPGGLATVAVLPRRKERHAAAGCHYPSSRR